MEGGKTRELIFGRKFNFCPDTTFTASNHHIFPGDVTNFLCYTCLQRGKKAVQDVNSITRKITKKKKKKMDELLYRSLESNNNKKKCPLVMFQVYIRFFIIIILLSVFFFSFV